MFIATRPQKIRTTPLVVECRSGTQDHGHFAPNGARESKGAPRAINILLSGAKTEQSYLKIERWPVAGQVPGLNEVFPGLPIPVEDRRIEVVLLSSHETAKNRYHGCAGYRW